MKFKQCLMILCFLFMTAAPAQAAKQTFEHFTAAVPAKWQADQEGASAVFFLMPDETGSVIITCKEYLLLDAELLAQEASAFINKKTLRKLPDGQGYIYAGTAGGRAWLMGSGTWVITVDATYAHKDILPLLRSIKTKNPELGKIFTSLADSEVLAEWFSFTGNEPASSLPLESSSFALPDFATFRVAESEKTPPPVISQELQRGWSSSANGPWVVATSEKNERWVAACLYPVAEADKHTEFTTLPESAKQIIAKIGGGNLTMSEGIMYFQTPFGLASLHREADENWGMLKLYNVSDAVYDVFIAFPNLE